MSRTVSAMCEAPWMDGIGRFSQSGLSLVCSHECQVVAGALAGGWVVPHLVVLDASDQFEQGSPARLGTLAEQPAGPRGRLAAGGLGEPFVIGAAPHSDGDGPPRREDAA